MTNKILKNLILGVNNRANNFAQANFEEREFLNELSEAFAKVRFEFDQCMIKYSRNGYAYIVYPSGIKTKRQDIDGILHNVAVEQANQCYTEYLEHKQLHDWEKEAKELADLYQQEAEETIEYDHYIIRRVGSAVSVYDINDPAMQRDINKEIDEEIKSFANMNKPTLDWWKWVHDMSVKYAKR